MPSENNNRIAKNTILLYFRMILVIVITFYTSRVVLNRLGANDYGVYSVVGGIVTMFSILSASLSSAISRFLTYELGKKNEDRLKTIFSTSVIIQGLLGLLITILLETGGVWFLYNKMNINPERMVAANWVLQCSAITFVINMLSVPYNAAIIAHEKMQAFAYISLLEVSLKLGIAFLLYVSWFDSLIVYAILIAATSVIIRIAYGIYCKRHFKECKLEWAFDKRILKDMLSYSGWNFIGSSSAILRDQGVNIIINIFCGTVVNAARGVAMQINTAVHGFSQNFLLAVNPQIIKSYASGDMKYVFNLAFRSSRFSYYLLFCLSLPLIVDMKWILNLWLTDVPEYTASFSVLVLILGMVETLSIPLMYINQAYGKIKVYQLTVGGIQMLNFPLAYLLLWMKFSPNSVFVLSIVISLICIVARLAMLRYQVKLPVRRFFNDVLAKCLEVTIIGTLIPVITLLLFTPSNFVSHAGIILLAFISACASSYFIGCNAEEKQFIEEKANMAIKKLKHNA